MFAVVVITYNRKELLRETLRRFQEQLTPQPDAVYIADDGSIDGTQAMLQEEFPAATLVQSNGARLGGNSNAGLRAAFAEHEIVLHTQDDYYLMQPLDLSRHIDTLLTEEAIGWIRLGNVHAHSFTARLNDQYWHVDWYSPSIWIASDQPHLKHRRFHEAYGWYPEGLPVAETEVAWCCTTQVHGKQVGTPVVAVPVYQPSGLWWHAGDDTSFNQRGL